MRTKKSLTFFLTLGLLIGVSGNALAKPPYPVFGYLPDYDGGIALGTIDWNDMTHVMECFAVPTLSGGVSFQNNPRANLITTAHANNTRCLLTFGGQFGSGPVTWDTAMGTGNTFIGNIMNTVVTNGYDGVDIDYEFPTGADKTTFMTFMQSLAVTLHATVGYDGQPRQLTFFISPGSQICGVDWATIANYADYGILSGYAYGLDSFNGPLAIRLPRPIPIALAKAGGMGT